MPAKANLTGVANITTAAREQDFVTVFNDNWDALRKIMGIMRPIRKAPGTKLVSYKASLTLQSGLIGEGEDIPYSQASVVPVAYQDITIEKYAKAVSIEAVAKYGASVAVQKTDEAFRNELQKNVLARFYAFLNTGTLTGTQNTFQMALAMAKGMVLDKFQKLRKTVTDVVGFCNVLDVYEYIGGANITVQTAFGMNYIENFLGYSTLFLLSDPDIIRGRVIAVPVENIDLYYIDPSDSDFAQLGLNYTVQGETNLIGFHANGNYNTAVGESFAIMGMTLWAEYLDGIAVITVNSSEVSDPTLAPETQGTSLFEVPVSSIQGSDVAVGTNGITGTLKYLPTGNAITNVWGPGNFLAFKLSNIDAKATSVKVGLTPSEGSGLVEIITDPDKNGVAKITDKNVQKFTIVTSDGVNSRTKYYDLSGLTLETAGA